MKLDENIQVPIGTPDFLMRFLYDVLQKTARRVNRLAQLFGGNEYEGAQSVAFVSLTDATTIDTDASKSNHFYVTLGGNRTLGNPTNLKDGVILNWWVKQDGTGSRTLAYGSKFKWPSGSAPILTTAANSVDLITAQYHESTDILSAVCTKDFR